MTTIKIKILLVIAAILNMSDCITAGMIGAAEANIIYLFNEPLFFIGKLFLSVAFILIAFVLPNQTDTKKFIVVNFILYSIPVFLFGTITNTYAIMNPDILIESAKHTAQQKSMFYALVVIIPGLVIIIKESLTFYLFNNWRKKDKNEQISILQTKTERK